MQASLAINAYSQKHENRVQYSGDTPPFQILITHKLQLFPKVKNSGQSMSSHHCHPLLIDTKQVLHYYREDQQSVISTAGEILGVMAM